MNISPGKNQLFSEAKVLKTADEIVNNSTVLQNDDELFYPLAGDTNYHIFLYLVGSSVTVLPNIRMTYTVPAGAVNHMQLQYFAPDNIWAGGQGIATNNFGPIYTQAAKKLLAIGNIFVFNVNPGNFQIQWAQSTAAIQDTQVQIGSYLIIRKI